VLYVISHNNGEEKKVGRKSEGDSREHSPGKGAKADRTDREIYKVQMRIRDQKEERKIDVGANRLQN